MKNTIIILIAIVLSSCSVQKKCKRINNRLDRLCPKEVTNIKQDSSNIETIIKYKEVLKYVTVEAHSRLNTTK